MSQYPAHQGGNRGGRHAPSFESPFEQGSGQFHFRGNRGFRRGGQNSYIHDNANQPRRGGGQNYNRQSWTPKGNFNGNRGGRGGYRKNHNASTNPKDYLMPQMWSNPWQKLEVEYAKEYENFQSNDEQ